MSNTITAYFKGRVGVAESVYQNDYGMVMIFDSIELPAHFDCYFSILNQEEAIPGVGADRMVAIPNSVLANPGAVTIHIPIHTGANDSEVEYMVYFKVIGRARPIDDGTPVQMTAIEQALALLQNPIGNIEQIVNEALSFTGDTFAEMQAQLDADQAAFQEDMGDRADVFEAEIRGDISDVESDFDNLNAQFQTAVSALTVDSEVQNVRVGADGETYASAGEAVRTQFSNVKSDIDDLSVVTSNKFDIRAITDDSIISPDGIIYGNESFFVTDYIPVTSNENLFFWGKDRQGNYSNFMKNGFCAYDANKEVMADAGISYVSEGNPYIIPDGVSYVRINVEKSFINGWTDLFLGDYPVGRNYEPYGLVPDVAKTNIPFESFEYRDEVNGLNPMFVSEQSENIGKLIINQFNEEGLTNSFGYITGKNLFGGLHLVEGIKSVDSGAILDTDNKTIRFHGASVRDKSFTDFPFKENTQYTLILYGKNDIDFETNVAILYTDGTSSWTNIKFAQSATVSYAIYTSESGKTIDSIVGFFSSSWTTLYYENCGLFEGIVNLTEFEAYKGHSFPLNWEDAGVTVYGGEIDVINGKIRATKNADGTDKATIEEYNITPFNVRSIQGENYVLCYGNAFISMIIDPERYINEKMYSPDMFTGTDSQKLQKCFDTLADVGGNIVIDRTYTLDSNLIIRNDSDKQHFIHVVGIGKEAKIDCQQYEITALKNAHAYGGVTWSNISFNGTQACFDAGLLIRLFFTQCSFKGFVTVFKADSSERQAGETSRYIQTLYLNQCTLKGIGTGFYISGNGAYDLNICDCLIENATYAVRAVEGSLMSVRICNCVIEAIWTAGIYIGCDCSSAIISNNYFEAVPQTIYISGNKTNANLSIFNNYLVTIYDPAIIIEPNATLKDSLTAVIENNTFFAIYNPTMEKRITETLNLFGGYYMAKQIKAVIPSAILNTVDKTVWFPAVSANSTVFTDFQFKENTRYTLILYGRNPLGVKTNVIVRYTDGTSSVADIEFAESGVDSYAVYVTDGSKTVLNIGGIWADSETYLYYDKCGVFEGVVDESDFEPYAKPMIAFTTTPTVAQALSLKNNFANILIGNDGGFVVSNYIEASALDDLTVSGEYAYNGGIVIVNSSTSGILQRLYTAESSQWRFKPINGSWGNWNS